MHYPIPTRFGEIERMILARSVKQRKPVPCVQCMNAMADYLARARAHRERCRYVEVDGFYTWDDLKRLMIQQDARCVYCGTSIQDGYHIDHKTPLSRGGNNSSDNIHLTCPTCNLRKHAKTDDEFRKVLDILK